MPSITGLAGSIDLQSTDDQTIDVSSQGKLRIKPEYDAALNRYIAETEIEIIEIQANSTITPIDHDALVSDTFSDTTGYENTVQVGTTTSTFETNKYGSTAYSVDNSETHGTFASAGSGSASYGVKFTTKNNCKLISANKHASSDVTRARLFDSNHNTLSTTTFSGNTATFNYVLQTNTTYIIEFDKSGASCSPYSNTTPNFPQSKTDYNLINGSIDGTNNTSAYAVVSMITKAVISTGPTIIDIALPTLSGTVTHTELVCNCPDRETGDSVKYKLKNASQNDDALAVNTKNALVNLTTNPTGMEIQLTPKSVNPTAGYPSVKSYALKVWKA